MNPRRVMAVGECMIELRHLSADDLRMGFAGDTYNTAVYLRRSAQDLSEHVEVCFLTGLGDDLYSERMRSAWADEGIVDASIRVPRRQPGLYIVANDTGGERQFSYWRTGSAASTVFSDAAWLPSLAGDHVHFSGITLQLMSAGVRRAFLWRLRQLRADGTTVSFDTNFRASGWPGRATAAEMFRAAAKFSDIVLATFDDEELLFEDRTLDETVRRYEELGVREVLVKLGADGVIVAEKGRHRVRVPATPVAVVVDTTAAGDSFAGAYLAARLAGQSAEDAAKLGVATAAHVITKPGAITDRWGSVADPR